MKLIILLFISFNFLSVSHAAKRKRVNTKKLEKKYWTTKGYKTGVVQGRTFFKENRLKLGFENMVLLNDKYSKTNGIENYRLSGSYYLSERFAVNGFFENLSLEDNSALKAMRRFNAGGFILNHVKAESFLGGGFSFVPIYSKLSWMNKRIIYLDFSISPNGGVASYQQQKIGASGDTKTTPFVGLDLETNIFLNNHFSINLAYRIRAFQSEVAQFDAPTIAEDDKLNINNFLTLGLNFYF